MLTRLRRRARLRYRAWRYRLKLDRREIGWLRSTLRAGDVAVDVGAHKGGYTYWMRSAVGNAGRVFAFEPQPALADYLRRCVRDFGWDNVRVESTGLSSEPGGRTLHVPGAGPSPGASVARAPPPDDARRLPIRVDSLDRYLSRQGLERPVRLIKCDVEGHELHVFRGARRTLEADRPVLLFECEAQHDPAPSVSDVFAYLEALGYAGYFAWRGRLTPVGNFLPAVHQVVGAPRYANNFLFVPERHYPPGSSSSPDDDPGGSTGFTR